jgi:hypothetical protein
MKSFFIYLLLIIYSPPLNATEPLDDIKSNFYNEIVDTKKKYLSIKNIILSPYKNRNFSYVNHLDSLKNLLNNLEHYRRELYFSILAVDLSSEDIFFIDRLNNNSQTLIKIINEFRSIYYRISLDKINAFYSFKEYSSDMETLLILEDNMPY